MGKIWRFFQKLFASCKKSEKSQVRVEQKAGRCRWCKTEWQTAEKSGDRRSSDEATGRVEETGWTLH